MLIPVRVTIPRVGKGLGAPRCEYAEVPFGEIARAAALAMTDSCADLETRIALCAACEAAENAGYFDRMEEPGWKKER